MCAPEAAGLLFSRRGAAFADMTVDTFLGRLCALVPPPRFHMTRYYGVFASSSVVV